LSFIKNSKKPTLEIRDEDAIHMTNVGLLYKAQTLDELISLMSNPSTQYLKKLMPGDFLGNMNLLNELFIPNYDNDET
jgi:hypothetical protein